MFCTGYCYMMYPFTKKLAHETDTAHSQTRAEAIGIKYRV